MSGLIMWSPGVTLESIDPILERTLAERGGFSHDLINGRARDSGGVPVDPGHPA